MAPATVQRLPVSAPAAQLSLAQLPSGATWTPHTATGGMGSTPGTVREPAPRSSAAPPSPAPPSAATARVLQRVAEQAGLSGVPLTAVPSSTPTVTTSTATTAATTTEASAQTTTQTTTQASTGTQTEAATGGDFGAGAEIDELARRLIEPVGRLLRAELRRGLERAGRPYDGRR
ncbi:hypothetical protein GCM10010442_46250 [Kitasatospora kifunensis]